MDIKKRFPLAMLVKRPSLALERGTNPLSEHPPERIFLAPAVTVAVAASMPVLYLLQTRLPDGGLSLAFVPATLWAGGWWPGLLTSMFLHWGWSHVAMNAVGAFAFGPPIARLMAGPKGVAGFLLFYVLCGIVAAAGYSLVHPDSRNILVGASGAVFGLMGAAMRRLGRKKRGGLRSLSDKRFLTPAAAVMAVNAATGLIGLAPGMTGVQIAWEAHAFGFIFGALLISPWAKLFGPAPSAFDSPDVLRDPEG